MRMIRAQLTAVAAALMLAACGGGGSTADTTPAVKITSVKVFGDSLQDSGTFGIKFTVQGADSQLYVERTAALYGQSLCNFFTFTGTTFAPNSRAGCTNFAIGGGRIILTDAGASPADPRNVSVQLSTHANFFLYAPGDLLIIDGGGNDAADLVGNYLAAGQGSVAGLQRQLSALLTPTQIGTAFSGGAAGLAAVGSTYMTALADRFYDTIKTTALDRGAKRIVLMNIPGITNTPRFQAVLDGIAAASGGGAAGAAARSQSEALFKSWVVAFNNQLKTRVGTDERVALIDFYKSFDEQIASPAQFGLSNVKGTACPAVGVGSDGLPVYNFPACTSAALSAAPPAGVPGGADWWKSYAFSDGFHPTPYGHSLLATSVSRALARAGWL